MERGCGEGALLTLRFLVVDEVDSTNDALEQLPPEEAGEGVWLRADRQTAGRGRQGRAWASETGNLYASTIVELGARDPPPQSLAFVAALAVHSLVVARLGQAPSLTIKWPNDVLWDGAKLAGILLERHDKRVVVGIGVNLAHAPDIPGRTTVALTALGIERSPAEALHDLAQLFAEWLSMWRTDLVGVFEAWQAAAHPVGTSLNVKLPDDTVVDGTFAGIEGDGALRLRLASGEVRVIHAGDVFQL